MLDLSKNEMEGVTPGLDAALPALVELVLDNNNLRALGDELAGLPKLKKLSAKANRVAAKDPFSGQQVRTVLRRQPRRVSGSGINQRLVSGLCAARRVRVFFFSVTNFWASCCATLVVVAVVEGGGDTGGPECCVHQMPVGSCLLIPSSSRSHLVRGKA